MGRRFGKNWTTVHRQTVRLYDANKTDVQALRAYVRFLQKEIYKRVAKSKKYDIVGE